VLGDAGLGKTRIAAELLPHSDEPAVGLIAYHTPRGGVPPFVPWADALGLQADIPDLDRVCRACGSGLAGLPALGNPAKIAHDASACAQARQHHFVEWVPGLLARASAQRPIVLVLDDADRSHDAVWEMVLRLAWEYPDSRLFVLITARPTALAGQRVAAEVLYALEQKGMIQRVRLTPFSREDLRELATDHLQRDCISAALVDWLMAQTQGNPRLAVGLLDALVDASGDLQAPALDGVPDELACWVRAELAQLDPAALALVEVLSVGGDVVDPDDLVRLTGQPIEHVVRALTRLTRCGMVVEHQRDQSLRYQLAHPLTREVLYSDIGGARRRVMHRQVADTLLESGRAAAAVSHFVHAAQAGNGEAIDALIDMAGQAEHRGHCAPAWTIISALQDLLPIGDDRWISVFDAVCRRPDWGITDRTEYPPVETAAVRRMRQLLAGIGDVQRQADIRAWLGGLFACGVGDLDAGQQECRQALALCRQTGNEAAARSTALELARMRGWSGDLCGEELAARQLLSEAEQTQDRRGIAEALGALGHALGWQGRFGDAEDMLLRSVELAMTAARSSWMSQNLALLASFDACRGHLVSARTRWAQAAAASRPDDPVIGGCGAFIELLAGDLVMVTAHTQLVVNRDQSARSCLPVRLAVLAAIAAAERDCVIEARRNLGALTSVDTETLGVIEPLYWWAEGLVTRAEGRLVAAAAALQRAVDCSSVMSLWAQRGFVLADLAEVMIALGNVDAAARAASWAEDDARRTGAPSHQALHQFTMAWALIGRGCRDQAARAALVAADGFHSCGYMLLAARARFAYANTARRADHRAAQDALHTAVKAFDACGAVSRRQQARALIIQLEPVGRCSSAAVSGPGSLTTREHQVAELAAVGYTAAQVAAQLHIGVRTVETHLARVYRKLEITSKQQLVHRAAEFGFTAGP
jgi:DNA-binding CsgD family transcriptional regulator